MHRNNRAAFLLRQVEYESTRAIYTFLYFSPGRRDSLRLADNGGSWLGPGRRCHAGSMGILDVDRADGKEINHYELECFVVTFNLPLVVRFRAQA